jgi:predicted NAD-dependent protein-ADP-ribosyltransferase YbiA (DUF1768 family)
MDHCSFFIKDKALFGSFPTQEDVAKLEELGVRYFIDLTNNNESKTSPYTTKYTYIKYPISDRKIPENWKSFAKLIINICIILKELEKGNLIYVHCKGGHGRSGIVVASVLCHYFSLAPIEALKRTSVYHSFRPTMREIWRRIGSPQSRKQKDFVHKFFRYLKVQNNDNPFTVGFSIYSPHEVNLPDIGTFPNAFFAFQAFRDIENKEYVNKLKKGIFNLDLLTPLKYTRKDPEWKENKTVYMYIVLEHKFRQHESLKHNLMNTGLRPIINISDNIFWGKRAIERENKTELVGKNMLGKVLDTLRDRFLYEEEEVNNSINETGNNK